MDRIHRVARSRGITKLKASFAKIMRGVIGYRVYLWQEAKEKAKAVLQAQLEARDEACQRLRLSFRKLVKGDVAMRVYLWRTRCRSEREGKVAQEKASEIEREMARTMNRAVSKLQIAFQRIFRGELGVRVYIWGSRAKGDGKAGRLATKLELKMRSQGCQRLGDLMSRMVRGILGMILYRWTTRAKAHSLQMSQDAKAEALQMKMDLQMRNMGISKLQLTCVRMIRGETAARVALWSSSCRRNAMEKQRQIEAAQLEDLLASKSRSTGIARLKTAFAKISRGAVGYLIYIWHANVSEMKEATRLEFLKKTFERQQGRGIQKLKIAFARITRGELSSRIWVWHTSMSQEGQEFRDQQATAILEAKMHGKGTVKLQGTFARIMRGEIGMRVAMWRAKQRRAMGQGAQLTLKQEILAIKAVLPRLEEMAEIVGQRLAPRLEDVAGQMNLLGRASNTNREELEIRLERQWQGIGEAMEILGHALNLRDPLLHTLHQRDKHSPESAAQPIETQSIFMNTTWDITGEEDLKGSTPLEFGSPNLASGSLSGISGGEGTPLEELNQILGVSDTSTSHMLRSPTGDIGAMERYPAELRSPKSPKLATTAFHPPRRPPTPPIKALKRSALFDI